MLLYDPQNAITPIDSSLARLTGIIYLGNKGLNMVRLKSFGYPLLLGVSRKSVIGHILDLPPQERLEGTLAAHVLGIQQGVAVLRVHDVTAHRRAVRVADKLLRLEDSLE